MGGSVLCLWKWLKINGKTSIFKGWGIKLGFPSQSPPKQLAFSTIQQLSSKNKVKCSNNRTPLEGQY